MKSALLTSKIILIMALLGLATACGDNSGETAPGEPASQAEAPASQPAPEAESMPAAGEEPASTAEPAAEESAATDHADADSSTEAGADNPAPETHTVTARSTAYDPMVLKIKPGDRVRWINMSGHNNNFEPGNIPEGAEPWRTALGEDVSRTFDVEGIYLYKCDPHFALGMVGAIIVGEPVNLEQVSQNAQGMYKRALAKAKAVIE